jgi:hypothetical protein
MPETNNEEKVLFPEAKVGDVVIKPWSFGMLFEIADLLGKVIDKAEQRNLIEELNSSNGFLHYTTFVKIFSIAGPEVMEIIQKTVKIDKEIISNMSMDDGLQIAFIIFEQNKTTIVGSIKKAFSLFPTK